MAIASQKFKDKKDAVVKKLPLVLAAAILAGCASSEDQNKSEAKKAYEVNKSYLAGQPVTQAQDEFEGNRDANNEAGEFESLQTLSDQNQTDEKSSQIDNQFNDKKRVTLAANEMPMNEFLHYAFGEVLEQNYVLSPDLKGINTPVTLNVSQAVSKKDIYDLVSKLLARQQVSIDFNDGLFFIQASALTKSKAAIGIGRTLDSVPAVNGQILQVIPLKYGIRISMERTVRQLIDATITADFEQNAIFVLGDKSNVSRAIELVQMLDAPANRGQNIGLVGATYVPLLDLVEQTQTLLQNEGLSVGIIDGRNKNIALVPLNHIGALAVFATSEELLNRVRYWVSVLDKPPQGDTEQYFVYNPRFARATDLGESIGRLLTLGQRQPASVQRVEASTGENADQLQAEAVTPNQVVNGKDISFVVDERSNSLIFSSTGSKYQALLPLLRRLDVLPKQVLLEITIAEVTMVDQFSYGVEFALRNSGKLSTSTLGAFGEEDVGGLNIGFLDSGTEIRASFFEDDQYINILSNPTLLVRDGVSANIMVGSDVPNAAGTVTRQDGTTVQDLERRQTGVDVSVTPTVNAQGVVIMNLQQNISNVESATANNAAPSFFERRLNTEVVVESGKTVMLAGLISENVAEGEGRVPVLGDLPVVGALFRGANNNRTKTELVMLVTPKVITQNDNWDKLISDFERGLENIRLSE